MDIKANEVSPAIIALSQAIALYRELLQYSPSFYLKLAVDLQEEALIYHDLKDYERSERAAGESLGFLVAGLAWIGLAVRPSVPMFALAFAILALGEMMYAARFYEYVSRLAPSGQQGLYMGYAFLPVAIGYFIAGILGGHLLHYFGVVFKRPQEMWWVVVGVGIVTAALMWAYDAFVRPPAPKIPLCAEEGPSARRLPAAL